VRAGAERRYNDRDVRDDPRLEGLAIEYLEAYTGEFEFLIDMKMRVAADYGLTTGMVRGVLNCMRNDPRVRDLPEPGIEEVAPLRLVKEGCPLIGREHGIHWIHLPGGGQQHCLGWHAMTRDITQTTARFPAPYLRGRSSDLVHRSTHEGVLTWFPRNFHTEGQAEVAFWEVKPVCPLPALKNPDLLAADDVWAAEPRDTAFAVRWGYLLREGGVHLCSRCFPRGETP
jgi:hypothetical protein